MALQFIFGGSGSGKSYYLYNRIIKESGEHPERNYMVLVPEQFTMQTQKDLVLMHENKGIMNIDVLSFARLAHRIFEETGKGGTPVLDDEGKNLILRKIAGEYEADLKVLKGNMKRLGYISEVKSVISEFTQYDIGAEEIEQVMEACGEGSYLYYKLSDIKILYEGFQSYLKEKYITKEELLDVLCDAAGESALLKRSTVVLDGFTGFTPVQNRLLLRLMKICRDVIVTVAIDGKEDPFTKSHPYQLFGMSKHMAASLVQIAGEQKIPVKDPVFLNNRPYPRFKNSLALGFLEQSLFRYSKAVFEDEPEGIAIHTAQNPREEAFAAAATARRLIREEGYRYREIGVIAADMTVYGDYLEQAFEKYQIPVFMDQKRSILLNSFVEYLRSLLAMVQENFTYDSVFRYLRTGYTEFTRDDIDCLENYAAALGIKGYKKWQQRFVRRIKGMDEPELEKVNHLRVLFVEKIDALVYVLKQRKKTVRDITEAVYSFLVSEDMQTVLKKQEEAFAGEGQLALAKEYAQIYGIVLGLFDKFVELLGDEQVSLEEYLKLLDAGLDEAKVGVIPPGVDQVVAGDMERTRLKDVKALIFVGANDTFLPGSLIRTGLLSEHDREKFSKEKLNLTPGGKEKAYIQKFYLYLNLTKPTRKLYLFYSRVSSEGKSIRPSYLVQEIRRIFPKVPVVEEEKKTLRERELTEAMGVGELIEGLRMKSETAGSAWMELYSWYISHQEWALKIQKLLEAGFYKIPEGKLSARAAKELYGENFEDSITRMERYSACAFAHFLTYGLKLKERQEYEFQALDMGNVFHGAIERYSRKAEKKEKGWMGISTREREQLVEESVEEAITDYGNSVLYSTARNEHMITRIKRMMNRTVWALTEQLKAGDFVPEAYEMRFGNGKIDRVDTCIDKDEVYVKVLDYKTGMTAFDISALYNGLQLQLMVYMNAALDYVKEKYPAKEPVPAGVFYYHIQDPLIEKEADEKKREEKILKTLRPDGIVNLEKESLGHLDRNIKGESLAVPVKLKKDNSISGTSKTVTGEEFRTMAAYAREQVEKIHGRILDGDVRIRPYRQDQKSGCDYCAYRHICGFDLDIPGYGYRNIEKLDKPEALGKMRAVLDGKRKQEKGVEKE